MAEAPAATMDHHDDLVFVDEPEVLRQPGVEETSRGRRPVLRSSGCPNPGCRAGLCLGSRPCRLTLQGSRPLMKPPSSTFSTSSAHP